MGKSLHSSHPQMALFVCAPIFVGYGARVQMDHPMERRMMFIQKTWLVAAAISLTLACDGSNGDGGDGGDDVDIGALADAQLAFINRCPNLFGQSDFLLEAEPALDRTNFSRESLLATLEAQAQNPALESDAAAAAACIEVLGEAPCDNLADVVEDLAVCSDIFQGTRSNGEGCANEDECASELSVCSFADDGQCGVCTAIVLAAEGESCASNDCDDGLFCADRDNGQVCVTYPGEGDACPDFECAAGLRCDDNNICSIVVEPIFELGSSCENTCDPFSTGLFCDDGTCAAIEVVDVGETCVPGTETPLWCINQSNVNTCADSDGDGTSTCEALPTVGESCAASFRCDTTATCVDGQCEARGAEGESCEQVECQEELLCNADNICEAFQDDSAVCPA
jgi:hypothetical protein